MIDKSKIIETVCERLEKLPIGHYVDLKTYKRNRTVIIVKIEEKKLLVIEDGYLTKKSILPIFAPSNHSDQQLYNPGVESCLEYSVAH